MRAGNGRLSREPAKHHDGKNASTKTMATSAKAVSGPRRTRWFGGRLVIWHYRQL